VISTLAVEKNANFFVENWQKSQKIVIATSTPGLCFKRRNKEHEKTWNGDAVVTSGAHAVHAVAAA
jgi:hydrogenase maturation factor